MPNSRLLVLAVISALAMTACGGGGSAPASSNNAQPPAAGSPPTPGTTPTPPTQPGTPGTGNTPTPTDATMQVWQVLNSERQQCGFGSVARNTRLDQAANGHANYLVLNNQFSHSQIAGSPGFTGAGMVDRVNASGYAWSSLGEDIAMGNGEAGGLRQLLAAAYHMEDMMSGYRDVGIGLMAYSGAWASRGNVLVLDFGVASNATPQQLAADAVLTYPCQGSSGVATGNGGESPSYTGSGSGASGQPILVQVATGNRLQVNSRSVLDANGINVATVLLTADNDPNRRLQANQALIIPPTQLQAATRYTVTLTGSNNGVAFSRSFTFSTR